MSIQILTDRETGNSCMYCNTTEWAFGPVFGEEEDPIEFLEWYNDDQKESMTPPVDVRCLTDKVLEGLVDRWRVIVKENEAEAAGERHFTEPEAWAGGFADNH